MEDQIVFIYFCFDASIWYNNVVVYTNLWIYFICSNVNEETCCL